MLGTCREFPPGLLLAVMFFFLCFFLLTCGTRRPVIVADIDEGTIRS